MPQKLQLKLLSNSGELLNMVTCNAGRVSVLRSSVPSELRPYQRVLSGTPGKENITVVCDGTEYRADEHTIIGFGEPSPTTGLSVREFLAQWDVPDSAVDSLLLSVGLENTATKSCSELSADQTARLRLVAATTDPDKILVLNDPFDQISGQWRERIAELLATFALARKVIVVIPSLSYRPECWIDNQIVERIEVAQTSHRTIGFGSTGSVHDAMINELREKFAPVHPTSKAPSKEPDGAAPLSAVALGLSTAPLHVDHEAIPSTPRSAPSLIKIGGALVAAGMGVWVITIFSPQLSRVGALMTSARSSLERSKNQPADQNSNTEPRSQAHSSANKKDEDIHLASQSEPNTAVGKFNAQDSANMAGDYVLDHYPDAIRISVLNTAQGITSFHPAPDAQPVAAVVSNSKSAPSGNLFSLLEQAGRGETSTSVNEQPEAAWQPEPEHSDAVESDLVDANEITIEDERREAIRNRFLEAIRAAAEERQREGGGE